MRLCGPLLLFRRKRIVDITIRLSVAVNTFFIHWMHKCLLLCPVIISICFILVSGMVEFKCLLECKVGKYNGMDYEHLHEVKNQWWFRDYSVGLLMEKEFRSWRWQTVMYLSKTFNPWMLLYHVALNMNLKHSNSYICVFKDLEPMPSILGARQKNWPFMASCTNSSHPDGVFIVTGNFSHAKPSQFSQNLINMWTIWWEEQTLLATLRTNYNTCLW